MQLVARIGVDGAREGRKLADERAVELARGPVVEHGDATVWAKDVVSGVGIPVVNAVSEEPAHVELEERLSDAVALRGRWVGGEEIVEPQPLHPRGGENAARAIGAVDLGNEQRWVTSVDGRETLLSVCLVLVVALFDNGATHFLHDIVHAGARCEEADEARPQSSGTEIGSDRGLDA